MSRPVFLRIAKRHSLPSSDATCRTVSAPVALLKQIAAISGDTVTLTDDQVWINGASLLDSQTLSYDSAGRPLVPFPRGTYQVFPGEYWLFATNLQNS